MIICELMQREKFAGGLTDYGFFFLFQLVKRCEEEVNQLDRIQSLFPNDALYLHDKDALSLVSLYPTHFNLIKKCNQSKLAVLIDSVIYRSLPRVSLMLLKRVDCSETARILL